MSNVIKKRAFRHDECEKSQCPIRRTRLKEIERLTEETKFLKSVGLSTPKASAKLESLEGYQRDCVLGRCEQHGK